MLLPVPPFLDFAAVEETAALGEGDSDWSGIKWKNKIGGKRHKRAMREKTLIADKVVIKIAC